MSIERKVGINASFLRKPGTGVGQVTLNVLGEIGSGPNASDFVLYLEEKSDLEILKKFQTQSFLPFYKRDDLIRKVLWEMFLLPMRVKKDGCKKFVSLYQCPTVFGDNISHTMVVHDIIPKLFPEYLNNLRKKMYWALTERAIKKADRIIAISENTKKDLMKHLNVSEEKIKVSYIDVDEIYKKEVSEEKSREVLEKFGLEPGYIYSGGGLEKRKNIDMLIRAYAELAKENENIPQLVVSGKLMPELAPLVTDVEKLVRELNIEEKVRLLGFTPQEDSPAVYHKAFLFVYPSLYEGFGMPVLEAMSQRVPVLASNASSIPEVGGEAAAYFDPTNISELKNKIKNLLENEEKRRDIAQKGKLRSAQFSWKSFVKDLMGSE